MKEKMYMHSTKWSPRGYNDIALDSDCAASHAETRNVLCTYKKRAQVSMEFIGLISFMFMIFVIFFMVINDKVVEYNQQKDFQYLQDLGEIIKTEMDLALKAENGYIRQFNLPGNLRGKFYNVSVESSKTRVAKNVVISFSNYSYSQTNVIMIPGRIEFESIGPGTNIVNKKSGKILIGKMIEGKNIFAAGSADSGEGQPPPETDDSPGEDAAQEETEQEQTPVTGDGIVYLSDDVKLNDDVKIL